MFYGGAGLAEVLRYTDQVENAAEIGIEHSPVDL